jgi:hypothetical protein
MAICFFLLLSFVSLLHNFGLPMLRLHTGQLFVNLPYKELVGRYSVFEDGLAKRGVIMAEAPYLFGSLVGAHLPTYLGTYLLRHLRCDTASYLCEIQ